VQRTTGAVAEHFPEGCKLTQPAGGFVLWVELPQNVDAVRLFELARSQRIAIAPGPMFTNTGRYRNFIRLNCGHLWSSRLELALAQLGQLANQLAQGR
jgi:DNA-binding transcriptional MocR family regulator